MKLSPDAYEKHGALTAPCPAQIVLRFFTALFALPLFE
jgi:hypothetical protein